MDDLPISVIIIARNAEKTLDDCLKSVQGNSPAEIILVDGNSADRTVEIAQEYTQKVHSDKGRGESYARQLGAEQATQEYIAYVDSDVVLTDGALATMLTEFQGSEYVSLRAHVSPGMEHLNYWEQAQHQHSQWRHVEHRIGTLACLFRRETILQYGFDLSPGGLLDDVDLEFRLLKAGYIFGASTALVYHRHRANLKSLAWRKFKDGRGMSLFILKHGPWYAGYWPPLTTVYWLAICLIKGKPSLIPYFLVDGAAKTAGMAKGFLELIGEVLRKTKH